MIYLTLDIWWWNGNITILTMNWALGLCRRISATLGKTNSKKRKTRSVHGCKFQQEIYIWYLKSFPPLISPIFKRKHLYLLWLVVALTHVGLRLWLRLTRTGSSPATLSSDLGLDLLGLFHLPDRSEAECRVSPYYHIKHSKSFHKSNILLLWGKEKLKILTDL